MEQLERPSEAEWDERRLWFEELEARYASAGAPAPSEQACALMIDLQAVFCTGAWAAAVILACAVTEAQGGMGGGSKRDSLPGVPDSDYRWLRALRNRLCHENRGDPELTVEDQWLRRGLWEERARRAVAIAFASLYPQADKLHEGEE